MKNLSSQEEKFLQGVWGKARYLEYLKAEEEVVKGNQRRAMIKNIRIAIVSILILAISTFVIESTNFNFGVIALISIVILDLGSFYEYMEERGIRV